MDQNLNTQPVVSRPPNSEKFSDEKTKQKIHKHITDINDTISEQDIQNVITDVSIIKSAINSDADEDIELENNLTKEDKEEVDKTVKQDKDEVYGTEEKNVNSPWDVLGA